MSASSTPTDSPRAAIAAARLTVTLDLPTPPLPDATAYTRVSEPGLGERDDRFPRVAAQLLAQLGALLVVHHVEGDLDGTGAGHVGDGTADALGDLGLLRAGRGGQIHLDVHAGVGVDGDVLDHAEFGDRPPQLGVDHLGQRGADRGFQVRGV